MRILAGVLVLGFALGLAGPAAAQVVGILQSAETVDRGNVKLLIAPQPMFGKSGADDEFGIAARLGYGFTSSFDAEAKVAFFENSTALGADLEYWALKNAGVDGSLTGGIHYIVGSEGRPDLLGFELVPQLSAHVADPLELGLALGAYFESVQDAPVGVDDSFSRMYLVPGLEYRLSEDADLDAEVGVGLNDDSNTYLGAGITFYLR